MREFVQCDIDILGDESIRAEIELIDVTARALLAIGFQDFTVNIEVKGLENAKRVSAIVLDNDRDNAVTDVIWHNNILTLSKQKAGSAAFSVTFEL